MGKSWTGDPPISRQTWSSAAAVGLGPPAQLSLARLTKDLPISLHLSSLQHPRVLAIVPSLVS